MSFFGTSMCHNPARHCHRRQLEMGLRFLQGSVMHPQVCLCIGQEILTLAREFCPPILALRDRWWRCWRRLIVEAELLANCLSLLLATIVVPETQLSNVMVKPGGLYAGFERAKAACSFCNAPDFLVLSLQSLFEFEFLHCYCFSNYLLAAGRHLHRWS